MNLALVTRQKIYDKIETYSSCKKLKNLEANVEFNDVVVYEGGEELMIPIFDTIEDDSTLAPWRGRIVKICNKIKNFSKVLQKNAVIEKYNKPNKYRRLL